MPMIFIIIFGVVFSILLIIIITFIVLKLLYPVNCDKALADAIRIGDGFELSSFTFDAQAPHVRQIPAWHGFVPFMGTELASTIYPYIYLPEQMYKRFLSSTESYWEKSVLMHEEVHLRRQVLEGSLGHLKYLFLSHERILEELIPVYVQMKYLYTVGETYNIERKARQFSSSVYLWALNYKDSHRLLTKINQAAIKSMN